LHVLRKVIRYYTTSCWCEFALLHLLWLSQCR